ncbi:MAG TPA: pyridoxal-dependent decarboxylase [Gemmatimonadaceae bacterium]
MPNDTATSPGVLGDLPSDAVRASLHRMADWVADYRDTLEQRSIAPSTNPGEIAGQYPAELPESGESLDTLFGELDTVVAPGIVHWGHPSFLGYFGSTSNGAALLGEIAAAALNVNAMTWRTSPAATELETLVLGWIRRMIGLPDTFTGIVYDTASVGVLHALTAARERCAPYVRQRGIAGRADVPTCRVYASDQAHSSADKAMIVLGLGEHNVVRVPSDAEFRMHVGALRAAMDADRRAGMMPLAVIATIGTTSTASVDPVADIAAVCREAGAWLHVDAAYGGAMGVLPEGRWALGGVELADSMVINPHKWLFVPLDFSVLYTRHPGLLRSVFSLTPEYLRGDSADGANGRAAIDYMDYGLQLGRRFRALKAWMVLRAFGRAGIAARIREHLRLARVWAQWVEDEPSFVLAAPVSMGVVCFRFAPAGVSEARCDRLNEAIVAAVNASGETYLTHTSLRGRIAMRIGLGNILTTERHLLRAWECVRREAGDTAKLQLQAVIASD